MRSALHPRRVIHPIMTMQSSELLRDCLAIEGADKEIGFSVVPLDGGAGPTEGGLAAGDPIQAAVDGDEGELKPR